MGRVTDTSMNDNDLDFITDIRENGLITQNDLVRDALRGVDCVLAFETASDYLGTNKMS